MRTCYVAIPWGVRNDPDGRPLDFDYLYREVLLPAVIEVDMDCRRLEEFEPGAMWQKTLFTALIASDLMIADVSTQNPNVLYELGVRHALKRGRTLLISAGGRLPANISYLQALFYNADESGRLTGHAAEAFRDDLQSFIRQSQRSIISDSPIYEFFPDLQVILPPELEKDHRRRRSSVQPSLALSLTGAESPEEALQVLRKTEEEVRGRPDVDPVAYLDLIKKYQQLSQWDTVIHLARTAPPEIASSPDVRKSLAFAFNRLGQQDQAIAIMSEIVAETGGDADTLGFLGRLYKDRAHGETGPERTHDLDVALDFYDRALAKNPNDSYLALNVIYLLGKRKGDADAQARAVQIAQRFSAAFTDSREFGHMGYWELSTATELLAVAGNWHKAEEAAQATVARAPEPWIIEALVLNLESHAEAMTDANDRRNMSKLIGLLQQNGDQSDRAAE